MSPSNISAPAALSLKQGALGDLESELASTRRVLERVPEAHYAWKPHEKSMSLGALAHHLANLPIWGIGIVQDDAYDLATAPPNLGLPEGPEALLGTFDANAAGLRDALERIDDEGLTALWTLRHGDHVVARLPRVAALRTLYVSHTIHHRAQLGVYLRLLDVPVPAVYGPTADEAPA